MIGLQFDPIDSWFFRDGTPFTTNSTPQEDVSSLFPPYPPTVVGALRAALALEKGWSGRGRWPKHFNAVVGDGPDDLGALSFRGPFLLQHGEPLFPVPRHLLGERTPDGWIPRILLQPGPPVTCDLGDDIRLPEMPSQADAFATPPPKPGDDHWLTWAGLNAVLAGRVPHQHQRDVVASTCLWAIENRIGLERDQHLRSAKEGQLYSTRHVRLKPGVSLGMQIGGLPQDWQPPFDRLVPLGGESRLAECRRWETAIPLQAPLDASAANGRLALVALSPLDLVPEIVLGQQPLQLSGTSGAVSLQVVSACIERPQRIGGWDFRTRCPRPLRSILPPGSVLFCQPDQDATIDIAAGSGMAQVGDQQQWGFGLVALGRWPNGGEALT